MFAVNSLPVSYLTDVDGASPGLHAEIVVAGVSLAGGRVNGGEGGDIVGLDVIAVSRLEGTSILGADCGKDLVGAVNGGGLVGLVLDSGVGTGVEEDEGVLLGGDGGEVTLGDGGLESGDAVAVEATGTVDGGAGDGTIGVGNRGDGGHGGTGGGDLAEGGTAVHLHAHGGAGAL